MFNGTQNYSATGSGWNSLFTDQQQDHEDQFQSTRSSGPNVSINDIIDALVTSRDAQKVAENKLQAIMTAEKAPPTPPIDVGKSQLLYFIAHKLFANNDVWSPDSTLYQSENTAQYELRRLSMSNPTIEYEIKRVQWVDSLSTAKTSQNDDFDGEFDTDSEFDNDFTKRYNL